jgi:hypothetical protein
MLGTRLSFYDYFELIKGQGIDIQLQCTGVSLNVCIISHRCQICRRHLRLDVTACRKSSSSGSFNATTLKFFFISCQSSTLSMPAQPTDLTIDKKLIAFCRKYFSNQHRANLLVLPQASFDY